MFHEEDSSGSKTENGTWTGIMALVISGKADIGLSPFVVTKERSEVVTYTDTLRFSR